jgi:hypothetical protein
MLAAPSKGIAMSEMSGVTQHLAHHVATRHDFAPLIDEIWTLDQSADVSGLASLASPAA